MQTLTLNQIQQKIMDAQIEQIRFVADVLARNASPEEIQMGWQSLLNTVYILKDMYYEVRRAS